MIDVALEKQMSILTTADVAGVPSLIFEGMSKLANEQLKELTKLLHEVGALSKDYEVIHLTYYADKNFPTCNYVTLRVRRVWGMSRITYTSHWSVSPFQKTIPAPLWVGVLNYIERLTTYYNNIPTITPATYYLWAKDATPKYLLNGCRIVTKTIDGDDVIVIKQNDEFMGMFSFHTYDKRGKDVRFNIVQTNGIHSTLHVEQYHFNDSLKYVVECICKDLLI